MLNVMKKYSGVVFFYLVIVGMILLINLRFNKLESTPICENIITYSN